ncbi:helix-turn-helix domain-containing protein [Streptomyces sp. enrichment culture]|uniref:helix-turn-helix domain-containing protein n=1 Tax=Streptomyces sp. enrichment culture TaxID=1795815 RepID=UPI003F57F31A
MPKTLPTSAEVIARIRRVRQARNMSVQALADAVTANGHQLSRGTLANQECGRALAISVDQVVAIAQVFGVPVSTLLEDAQCEACKGAPPRGFSCNACGKSTSA